MEYHFEYYKIMEQYNLAVGKGIQRINSLMWTYPVRQMHQYLYCRIILNLFDLDFTLVVRLENRINQTLSSCAVRNLSNDQCILIQLRYFRTNTLEPLLPLL